MTQALSDKFVRQRRNILVVSIIIILYKAGDINIDVINILGNQIKIGDNRVVVAGLVVAFLYFMWRYYTACREALGIRQFRSACVEWAEKKCARSLEKKYLKNSDQYIQVDNIERRKWHLVYKLTKKQTNTFGEQDTHEVTVIYRYIAYKIVAPIFTTLNTSTFSEYVLPYLVATVAALALMGIDTVGALFKSYTAFTSFINGLIA